LEKGGGSVLLEQRDGIGTAKAELWKGGETVGAALGITPPAAGVLGLQTPS